MKSTNRIHRNSATKSAPSQAKITSEHKPDSIAIVINDEDGKPFADFEIPTALHSAMVMDAYAQKITVLQWIENAVRYKISRSKSADNSPALASELLIPSEVVQETEAALLELEQVGNAAVTLVMMNAFEIDNSSQCDLGWVALEAPGFSKGSQELARIVSAKFASVLAYLNASVICAAAPMRECHDPVNPDKDVKNYRFFDDIDPNKSWFEIENCIQAFKHLLNLQDWVLGNNNQADCNGITCIMRDKLDTANGSINNAYGRLSGAFTAIAVRQADERRAAA
jgi:hypothetical protein